MPEETQRPPIYLITAIYKVNIVLEAFGEGGGGRLRKWSLNRSRFGLKQKRNREKLVIDNHNVSSDGKTKSKA